MEKEEYDPPFSEKELNYIYDRMKNNKIGNLERKEFILTIIDHGKEFNPFLTNNQPLEGDISNKKEGGLGILIVKKLMSEYAHDYINKKNILILKKKF